MKYCWSNGKTLGGRIGPLVLISLIILVPIFIWIQSTSGIFPPVLLIDLFIVYRALFSSWVSERKYEITRDGMYIKFPLTAMQFHRWSEFSEIALCKVHYAARSDMHTLAIRCVIGEEEFGPKRARVAKEIWSFTDYEYRHYKKIISIYYTEDRYAEFQSLCPLPIKDYRYLRNID